MRVLQYSLNGLKQAYEPRLLETIPEKKHFISYVNDVSSEHVTLGDICLKQFGLF